MGKKRIFMCAESSHIDSGFGNYTRNILSRLYATGKYEIAELSAYRSPNMKYDFPWKIYPVVPPESNQEILKTYATQPHHAFGSWAFETAIQDFKPDIVFDVRDYWMLNFPEVSPYRPFYHWMIAPTIDSAPQRKEWLQTFSNADTVSGHTQWGIDYLRSTHVPMNLVEPVNDAVNVDVFKPSSQPKDLLKTQLGVDPKDFIIGSVMRNQKRKLIPNLIKIIKQVAKVIPNAKLYLHTSYPDMNAWDIPSLLMEHDAVDLVYFSYKCANCGKHFARKYSETPSHCPHCNHQSASFCSVANGLSEPELANVFNCFDLYIQYAICEGFGIPPVEAASCGVPVVTMAHGAMAEIGNNIGADIVPLSCTFRELETNADRVYPDDKKCEEILIAKCKQIQDMGFITRTRLSEETRTQSIKHYDWDKTAKTFENIFDNITLTGLQGKWDVAKNMPRPEIKVPQLGSHRKTVQFIINHIIKNPHMLKTASIQQIIRNLDLGYQQEGQRVSPFSFQQAMKILEDNMNTRTLWESVRVGETPIPETLKYIIDYS
jgi:glycosyltransferase involved in cell wall biosynthesis